MPVIVWNCYMFWINVSLPFILPYWWTNDQFYSHVVIMKFNSSKYWVPWNVPTTVVSLVIGVAKKMTFSYFFINMNRIHLRGLRNKRQKKKRFYNPTDLEAAARKKNNPRSNLRFRLTNKFSKSSMWPPPVLSECEEQVLIEWTTDRSRKDWLRGR